MIVVIVRNIVIGRKADIVKSAKNRYFSEELNVIITALGRKSLEVEVKSVGTYRQNCIYKVLCKLSPAGCVGQKKCLIYINAVFITVIEVINNDPYLNALVVSLHNIIGRCKTSEITVFIGK